jgi:hypothetical protein
MAETTSHKIIEKELRDFPWSNYGMDDVELGLADYPEYQQWVADLADNIHYELSRAERLQ